MPNSSSIGEYICYRAARWIARRRKVGDAGMNPDTFDPEAYTRWRERKLHQHFFGSFRAEEVQGKDVLDIGCGEGALSILVARAGAKSVTGVDLSQSGIENARRLCPPGLPISFVLGDDPKTINALDRSMDVILCFSMLEHVMEYQSIIREWRRVLRPDGQVLVWWMPWLHPYGHHVEDVLPLPWAHVFFSEETVIKACARMYDEPDFEPRLWDRDANGNKKANDYLTMAHLPDLNHLTMHEFERQCGLAGLRILNRKFRSLRGQLSLLTRIPRVREYFTSNVVYRLGVQPPAS